MRASELRALIWTQVDFDRGVICAWQRASRTQKIGNCKTKLSNREISLPDFVVETLQKWKRICPPSPEGLVFPSGAGTLIWHNDLLANRWVPLQLRIGMVKPNGSHKYKFHGLRHFYASLMIDQNTPPKQLQALLGHASIKSHLFPERDDDTRRINGGVASVLTGRRNDDKIGHLMTGCKKIKSYTPYEQVHILDIYGSGYIRALIACSSAVTSGSVILVNRGTSWPLLSLAGL